MSQEAACPPYLITQPRLRKVDMSRATVSEVVAHQLEAGSAVVDAVLGHRDGGDG